jgi:HAD superfamily phosphoserine phosphatase-like hydrolase
MSGVLVSDFDGTMTAQDFFKLAVAELLPPGGPDYWRQYLDGRLTHFETLRAIFSSIRADEATVLAVVDRVGLDPDLPAALADLRRAGWEVVVASAGCAWYIRRILARAGVDVEVHANPGRFEAGKGLLMELPAGAAYFSPTHGVDKAGVVRAALARGGPVAFAGDGFPDADAARVVPAELRFAKSDLAEALRRAGLPFRPFDRWAEVAHALLSGP